MTSLNLIPVLLANLGIGALAIASASSSPTSPPLILNETASMAKGVYARAGDTQNLRRGDIIAIQMNPASKDYLSGTLGYPDSTLLIKRVAGMEGDVFCRNGTVVTVGIARVLAAFTDAKGNDLPSYDGCWRLSADQVFLLGDDPRSFDSRYFGPVAKNQLIGTYRGIVTW